MLADRIWDYHLGKDALGFRHHLIVAYHLGSGHDDRTWIIERCWFSAQPPEWLEYIRNALTPTGK